MHLTSDFFDNMCNETFTTNLPPMIFNFTVDILCYLQDDRRILKKNPIILAGFSCCNLKTDVIELSKVKQAWWLFFFFLILPFIFILFVVGYYPTALM